jgi:hypothetical protein
MVETDWSYIEPELFLVFRIDAGHPEGKLKAIFPDRGDAEGLINEFYNNEDREPDWNLYIEQWGYSSHLCYEFMSRIVNGEETHDSIPNLDFSKTPKSKILVKRKEYTHNVIPTWRSITRNRPNRPKIK